MIARTILSRTPSATATMTASMRAAPADTRAGRPSRPCRAALLGALMALLAGCAVHTPQPASTAHVLADRPTARPADDIPPPVTRPLAPPQPQPRHKTETYSVVVNQVPVRELLFALARDARVNVDIHPGIEGAVTLNAIDQTLPQLLARIAHQVDMRFELDGQNLVVMPDAPFLRSYRVDYVNMSRDVTGAVSINTQIASTTSAAVGGATGGSAVGSAATAAGNSSSTRIENVARNRFWESLERNIRDLLRETDKLLPAESPEAPTAPAADGAAAPAERRTTFREAAAVILNPETGVINVRATSRQHEKVQEFITQVTRIARRQVLIEATIAEVQLTDNYQQGIDWTAFAGGGKRGGATLSLNTTSTDFTTNQPFAIGLGRNRELSDSIKLLETYGDVKVLSSPKLSVLNNQTALLKVVNNIVYFEIKSDVVANTNTQAVRSFTATPRSVSVGLVMAVTPQISGDGFVLLNVRPTISRKVGDAQDPTPDLSAPNLVPVIQTRELESVMRVASGETAVLGGLMQDEINFRRDSIPGVSVLPILGPLLSARNETSRKTELVVLIRPVVIDDASLDGDYAPLSSALPGRDFLTPTFPPPTLQQPKRPSAEPTP
ncbi:MAG: secretin N-terminal domain-containing protein [Methyloversatilis discipulorum]|uniref:secretin N-terminal domain-containing protein n=1 Tax=Methyloversatilis discipulorum TaxID=1119528 RepID=UPI003F65531D|nr:secretin N-terminal domain-containing protein [Methyloversatilis discipulorum]